MTVVLVSVYTAFHCNQFAVSIETAVVRAAATLVQAEAAGLGSSCNIIQQPTEVAGCLTAIAAMFPMTVVLVSVYTAFHCNHFAVSIETAVVRAAATLVQAEAAGLGSSCNIIQQPTAAGAAWKLYS